MMARRQFLEDRHDPQLSIPEPKQYPKLRREKGPIYRAVQTLRATGHEVIRAGRHHKVDGKQLTWRQLIAMAAHAEPKAVA